MFDSKQYKVHFMPGDGKGWALDEDLRQMRLALAGRVEESRLPQASIIHTPFWLGLSAVAPSLLEESFVIAHADNPPFFYLKQPDFLWGQQVVNLWVARSCQAQEQFKALGLPVFYLPYTIDEQLFFPVPKKEALRQRYQLPKKAYIIANFHRDTEGGALTIPKEQKAPEVLVEIAHQLHQKGLPIHLLLAGPRRHWVRRKLRKFKIPFTFVGKEIEEDDFGINILSREELNLLTNAADLYLIPSRWEGGPQSVMEAAAAKVKVLSTPVGVGCDILEPLSLFTSVAQAVATLEEDIRSGFLEKTIEPQWERWSQNHRLVTMKEGLQKLYQELPQLPSYLAWQEKKNKKRASVFRGLAQLQHRFGLAFKSRLEERLPFLKKNAHPMWNIVHQSGIDPDLDRVIDQITTILDNDLLTERKKKTPSCFLLGNLSSREVAHFSSLDDNRKLFQLVYPGMALENIPPQATLVGIAVQDLLPLRKASSRHPACLLPIVFSRDSELLSKEREEKKDSFEKSDQPLLVQDELGSLEVVQAQLAGRPILYPAKKEKQVGKGSNTNSSHSQVETASLYWEQLFFGGIAYHDLKELREFQAKLTQDKQLTEELKRITWLPSLEEVQRRWRRLS